MRKLLFALSFVGLLMIQSLAYASTILNPTLQETDQQEETVSDETLEEEAPVMEETVFEEEEEETAAAEASFTQELKKRFIEGGPGFMGIVLICLILGLAIAIERIIYLNLATTNSQNLPQGLRRHFPQVVLRLLKSFVEILRVLLHLFSIKVLIVSTKVLRVLKRQLWLMEEYRWGN